MKPVKRILISAAAALLLWAVVWLTDFICVVSGNYPVFCVRDESCFSGLGYSYEVYPHPIMGEREFALYAFGQPVFSNFTN